jgi:UDP:flavonoid glycosyltransferase YjiC (YdhE family)
VVSTGGLPVAQVAAAVGAPLPSNARLAAYLPYERLLPLTSVVVTNGGFGGVLQALRYAVPLVVAGDTADKPEVAARVRRVGAGIDLHSGTPSPRRLRRAVRKVLDDPSYRDHAGRISRHIQALGDPRGGIADVLELSATAPAHRATSGTPSDG